MTAMFVVSAGLMCLNACSTSVGGGSVPSVNLVTETSSETAGAESYEAAPATSILQSSEQIQVLSKAALPTAPDRLATVSTITPNNSSNMLINSVFNVSASAVNEIGTLSDAFRGDPVENFKLSTFAPVQSLVNGLAIDREFNNESVIDSAFYGEITFNHDFQNKGQTIDIGVAPRFSVWRENAFEGVKLGGEIRIGQDFDQRGKSGALPSGWYFFVGKDDEALTISGNGDGRLALMDQMTVGDLQTGLLIGGRHGQFILGLTRRTISYSDQNMSLSHEEDIGGLSYVRQF